jgi:hypothetical protein
MLFVLSITLWSLAKLAIANFALAKGVDIAFFNALSALVLTLLALYLVLSAIIRLRDERSATLVPEPD